MNKKDFKNPLIQSGALLLLVFLLISFVAGSGSQGILGSIGALISGIFSTVIFIVGLCIAILFSIAVLVGVYLAAVYFYSADKGRNLFEQLKTSLCTLYHKLRGSREPTESAAPMTTVSEPVPAPAAQPVSESVSETDSEPAPESVPERVNESKPPVAAQPLHQQKADPAPEHLSALEAKLDSCNSKLAELGQSTSANAEMIKALQQRIDELSVDADQNDKLAAFEQAQQQLSVQLQELADEVASTSTAAQKVEQQLADDLDVIKADLATLHDKTSVPEVVSGILSYIDTQEDRDTITEKAKEAISRGMTYSQIDDFFKASLSEEVYKELAAHPRLTKDFLRSIKKKF